MKLLLHEQESRHLHFHHRECLFSQQMPLAWTKDENLHHVMLCLLHTVRVILHHVLLGSTFSSWLGFLCSIEEKKVWVINIFNWPQTKLKQLRKHLVIMSHNCQ